MTYLSNELNDLKAYQEQLKGRMALLRDELNALHTMNEDIASLARVRRVLVIIVQNLQKLYVKIPLGNNLLSILPQLEKTGKLPKQIIPVMERLNTLTMYTDEINLLENRSEIMINALSDASTLMEWYLVTYQFEKAKNGSVPNDIKEIDHSFRDILQKEFNVRVAKEENKEKKALKTIKVEPSVFDVVPTTKPTSRITSPIIPTPSTKTTPTQKIEQTVVNPANEVQLIPYRKGHLWGFLDQNKKIVIEAKYTSVEPFIEELTAVGLKGKFGFINQQGEVVVPFQYDAAGVFKRGLAIVRRGDKWGFVNKTGEETVPTEFETTQYGSAGFAIFKQNDKWGFINKYGKVAIEAKYQYVYPFSDSLAAVMNSEGKCGYINRYDELIIVMMYDYGGPFRSGLAVVELFGKRGFINKSGRTLIPLDYEKANDFRSGLAAVKQNGRWGFINKAGATVIGFKYNYAFSFYAQLALVQKNNSWGYINREGEEVISCIYKNAESFSEELAAVQLDDKWGYIDPAGKLVMPFEYDYAGSFSNGLAYIIKNNGKSKGYIDKNGTEYFVD